jgi:HK97 family phage prohead protease
MIRRAYLKIEPKEFDESKREFEGIATSIGTDRYGDIVESEGAIFTLPIPLLWQHIASQPVGHVTEAKQTKKNIKVVCSIAQLDAAGTLKNRLDEAWQSLKLGLVRHLSVGFNPLKYEPIEDSEHYGYRFTEWEWLELSLVTIPANADASVTSVKKYDLELMRAASGNNRMVPRAVPLIKASKPGASGNSSGKMGQRRAVPLIKV